MTFRLSSLEKNSCLNVNIKKSSYSDIFIGINVQILFLNLVISEKEK